MTQWKFVYITEIHDAKTTNGKQYQYFLDHDKIKWSIWPEQIHEKVEARKGYVVEFEKSGEYNNIVSIRPAINKLKEQVAKEFINKRDLIKDITVGLSYSKDLAVNKIIPLEAMFEWSDKIYEYIITKSDKEFDKLTKKES